MRPFRLTVFSLLLMLPFKAGAIEVGGVNYGDSLGEDDLGYICRTAEDYDLRYELGPALEGVEVSVRFQAEAYLPTDDLLVGRVSYRAGAYASEFLVNVDISNSVMPEGMTKGDMLRVLGHMKPNEFFGNLIESCFVEVLATAVTQDGF